MNNARSQKIVMDGYGSYLGMEKGCFVLRERNGNEERYPLFDNEISEVVLRSGNMVSTGALASLGFWDVDVMVLTQRGKPVALMKSLDDDSYVKTRLCQYEALNNDKGAYIAKQIVLSKMRSQNIVLKKYNLQVHDEDDIQSKIESLESSNLDVFRKKLTGIEGKFTEKYFNQTFQLLPDGLRPEKRKKFKAYDGTNNIFNLAYEVLQWKIHRAIIKAKLEPYLGFLHSVQFGKPSLVCDFQELYRYLIDDFLFQYCQKISKKDFTIKTENATRKRKGKRQYLSDSETKELLRELNQFFEIKVKVARIRNGEHQTIETLINEEALLFAKFLRRERAIWVPNLRRSNY